MLDALKTLFNRTEDNTETSDTAQNDLHLAAAVLMVEAATMDGEFDDAERASIAAILERHFGLSQEQVTRLLALAEAEHEEANHLQGYTRTIKDDFSENQRLELIELLWEVVYADGQLHAYEANLLRRIGGLLYVSDRDRGDARKRVMERLGVKE